MYSKYALTLPNLTLPFLNLPHLIVPYLILSYLIVEAKAQSRVYASLRILKTVSPLSVTLPKNIDNAKFDLGRLNQGEIFHLLSVIWRGKLYGVVNVRKLTLNHACTERLLTTKSTPLNHNQDEIFPSLTVMWRRKTCRVQWTSGNSHRHTETLLTTKSSLPLNHNQGRMFPSLRPATLTNQILCVCCLLCVSWVFGGPRRGEEGTVLPWAPLPRGEMWGGVREGRRRRWRSMRRRNERD